MAKVVSQKIFDELHPVIRYPYDLWLDGKARQLKYQRDFRPVPKMMQRMVLAKARVKGIKVRTRVEGEYLYVQALYDTTGTKTSTGNHTKRSTVQS